MFINKRVTIAGAATFAMVLLAGGAYAALENDEAGASRAEITAVLAAKQAPADAIRAAEAKSGGRAVDFGLEGRDGTLAYDVTVATPSGLSKVTVDLGTGAAVGTTGNSVHATDPAAALAKLPMPLATAVTAAERQTGGRAMEARATTAGNQPAVLVTTAVSGQEPIDVVLAGADAHVVSTAKAAKSSETAETAETGGAAETGETGTD